MADHVDRELAEFLEAEFLAVANAITLDLEQEIRRLSASGGPSRAAIAAAVKRATNRVQAAEARFNAGLDVAAEETERRILEKSKPQ